MSITPLFESGRGPKLFHIRMTEDDVLQVIRGRKRFDRRLNVKWMELIPGDIIEPVGYLSQFIVTAHPYREKLCAISEDAALSSGVVEKDGRHYPTLTDAKHGINHFATARQAFFFAWGKHHKPGTGGAVGRDPQTIVIEFQVNKAKQS